MMYTIHLRAVADEATEFTDGSIRSDGRGHWQCTRTVRLPFLPTEEIELIDTREPAMPAYPGAPVFGTDRTRCTIERLAFDVHTGEFYAEVDWNVVFCRESTPEACCHRSFAGRENHLATNRFPSQIFFAGRSPVAVRSSRLAELYPGWSFEWVARETEEARGTV